jgi:hypothetical protein
LARLTIGKEIKMAFLAFVIHVYAREDGSVVIVPQGTDYKPTESDREIAEVVNILVQMNCGEVTKAIIECYPAIDTILVAMKADYRFKTEFDGKPRKIDFVRFDDGGVWKPQGEEVDLRHKFAEVTENIPEIAEPPDNTKPLELPAEMLKLAEQEQKAPSEL